MKLLFPALFVLVAACGEQRPQAPTAAEAERLNEAEAMLNALANEEAPAPAQEARQP